MKKVAIVGMATTSRHLAPFDDPEFEIWGLNESYFGGHQGPDKTPYFKRWTRWFQMHPKWDYSRAHNFNHYKHWDWLRNVPWTDEEHANKHDEKHVDRFEFMSWGATDEVRRRTDFPIYMLEYDEEVPGSEVYPLPQILSYFQPNSEHVHYFTNSFGYMMALAIYLGFKEIHAYGFEMSSETEYGSQKPNAEFWLGIAIGHGVKLVIPQGCRLLGQHEELYGYEKVPGITLMHKEIERNKYAQETAKQQAILNQVRGKQEEVRKEIDAAKASKQRGRINRAAAKMTQLVNQEVQTLIQLNAMSVAKQMAEKDIRDLKGLPSPDDIKLIPLGRNIELVDG